MSGSGSEMKNEENILTSRFSSVTIKPGYDEYDLNKLNLDQGLNEINLSSRYYNDDNGDAWTVKDMKKIEMDLAADEKSNHEYLHPLGIKSFRDAATKLLLGDQSDCINQGRAFGVQTLGGISSLALALEFLVKQMGYRYFYLSSPISDDHKFVFSAKRGKLEIRRYHYWDPILRGINFEDLLKDLSDAPENSVIMLQMCCHRPTGCDLTKNQWIKIANLMEERKLFPLFDSSNQGLASGDPDEDAWPVRYFVDRGFELLCAQSFSANLGLYGYKVGCLSFVLSDSSLVPSILSECTWNFYNIYGTPANHGAQIAIQILNDSKLKAEWLNSLKNMHHHIVIKRRQLSKKLELLDGFSGLWNHINEQKGFFSFSGFLKQQIDYLKKNHHIYLKKCGSFNISCLDAENIDTVAQAFILVANKYLLINNNSAHIQNAYASYNHQNKITQ